MSSSEKDLTKNSFSFPKSSRLLKNYQFRTVGKYGRLSNGKFLSIHIRDNKRSINTKLGITVTRKFGGAVERNRFKRLVREAFRLSQHQLPGSIELNVRPASKTYVDVTLAAIKDELVSLIT